MFGLTFIVAEKVVLKTPPMGWNTWNSFWGDINEQLIKDSADAFVSSGLKDAGYQYVVIDDNYLLKERDADGNMIPNPDTFPNGFRPLADYIHNLGLKFGMYNCAGTYTCMGLAGSFGYEEKDAKMFNAWDIDFLKYDFCFNPIVNQRFAPDVRNFVVDGKKIGDQEITTSGNAGINSQGFYGYIGSTDGYITLNADTTKDGVQDFTFEFVDSEIRPF